CRYRSASKRWNGDLLVARSVTVRTQQHRGASFQDAAEVHCCFPTLNQRYWPLKPEAAQRVLNHAIRGQPQSRDRRYALPLKHDQADADLCTRVEFSSTPAQGERGVLALRLHLAQFREKQQWTASAPTMQPVELRSSDGGR